MRKRICRGVGVAAMALLALSPCGCEDEDTSSDITPTRFYVERDLDSYSSVDIFSWDTTLDQAVATVRIKDFTHGDTTLRVFDDRGKLLLSRYLFTPYNTIYVGDNEFVNSSRTERGTPGRWRVELAYEDFTGDIDITME